MSDASERVCGESGASEQVSGESERVSGASKSASGATKRASGGANGPVRQFHGQSSQHGTDAQISPVFQKTLPPLWLLPCFKTAIAKDIGRVREPPTISCIWSTGSC